MGVFSVRQAMVGLRDILKSLRPSCVTGTGQYRSAQTERPSICCLNEDQHSVMDKFCLT